VTLEEPGHDPATWSLAADGDDFVARSTAGSAWADSRFQLAYRERIRAEAPAIARFLDRFAVSDEEAVAMSYAIDVEHREPAEVAAAWIRDNAARIEEWAK
jgi:glycine betaine/proline transport system substrate-binding protein